MTCSNTKLNHYWQLPINYKYSLNGDFLFDGLGHLKRHNFI